MKIISKFTDYYDTALAMGIDDAVIYIRKTDEIEDNKAKDVVKEMLNGIPERDVSRYINVDGSFIPFLVFFCGRVHLGYEFTITLNKGDQWREKEIKRVLYSAEDVKKAMADYKLEWPDPSRCYLGRFPESSFTEKNVESAFTAYSEKETDMNLEFKAPVIIAFREERKLKLFANPVLRDYEFARRMDPYTAFQELFMYMGGVLGSDASKTTERRKKKKRKYVHHEIPKSLKKKEENRVDIERHGFDYKWGFRKPPSKKK